MKPRLPFKHDHRKSMWIVSNGGLLWCYQCGAIRLNQSNSKWEYPTGKNGTNPAMRGIK